MFVFSTAAAMTAAGYTLAKNKKKHNAFRWIAPDGDGFTTPRRDDGGFLFFCHNEADVLEAADFLYAVPSGAVMEG